MLSRAPVFSTQLVGLLCGAVLGAVRTTATANHLLAKNQALLAAELPALPGVGHLETLASSAPAWAGALFFGLSLGLGWGSLCGIWAALTRALPDRSGWAASLLVLVPGLYAAALGDAGLAATLLLIALGALVIRYRALGRRRAPTPLLHLALACVCALGLLPWAIAEEGPFTRLRDQVLFGNEAGLALDEFYYRWTLYPAEVLKPVAARSQPVVGISPAAPSPAAEDFCRQAKRLGILCVDGERGSDITVQLDEQGAALLRGRQRVEWPQSRPQQEEVWKLLSRLSDRQHTLRRFTGWALFAGCPAGLCWLLASVALAVGWRFNGRRRSLAAATLIAALLAGLLAGGGLPDTEVVNLRDELQSGSVPLSALQQALRSPSPVARFYAARGARHHGAAAEPLLVEALTDPLINIRYAAAQSLGRVGGESGRLALAEMLRNPEDWYVKERAYHALQRIGWPAE